MLTRIFRRGLSVHPHQRLGSIIARKGIHDLVTAKRLWGNRMVISEEVHHALSTSQPVIALESAIITHGMPHPTNLNTASSLETIIRSKGVAPATIALINGKIHVGLTESDLIQLSDPDSMISKGAVKISRRDLGPSIAMKKTGGTTVAGTMYIAESLGIKVFVTGGIGGVHRGAENSMDISADLLELGRTPMAVFCAGAKSILDIPRTLEVLETQGVCVASYGDNQDFPAFYTPSSGCQSPWRVGDADAAARLIYTQLTLPSKLATLIGVPIPSEYADAGLEVQRSVEQAVRESVEKGIDKAGKEVTPWLLKRVGELTGGKALGLNVNLIENNARIGADVAVKLAELYRLESEFGIGREKRNGRGNAFNYIYSPPSSSAKRLSQNNPISSSTTAVPTSSPKSTIRSTPSGGTLPPPQVMVFGSAAIDLTSTSPSRLEPRTTTPGTIFVSPGGVGRNIAEAAQNILPENSVQLVSLFGSTAPNAHNHSDGEEINLDKPDAFGKLLMLELASAGLRIDGLIGQIGKATAACSLTLEKNGDLVAGVADMCIVETMSPDVVEQSIKRQKPEMVVFDCNITSKVIDAILKTCGELNIPTFCDPTSLPKIPRLTTSLLSLLPSSPSDPRPLTHLSPNVLELDNLYSLLTSSHSDEVEEKSWEYINSLNLTSNWRNAVERFTNQITPQTNYKDKEWISNQGIITKMIGCLPFISSFWLKASNRGLLHLHLTSTPPSPVSSSSTEIEARGRDSISYKLDDGGVHKGKWIVLTHYPSPDINQDEIVSTTGAGDTLVGGIIAGLINAQQDEQAYVEKALQRVKRSLMSRRAVG
ncbi:uncharacterized protein IL334_002422 [Kwoniella shivajii]|uniref:Indigoidine synthase A family protein n=1 Tax=Kwoniella shivajii TaxID=564305 RepID=A0ABZ1CWE6_9TREE|nr:hypothetical protein IL334_002422 [Kwoniella shivajii]